MGPKGRSTPSHAGQSGHRRGVPAASATVCLRRPGIPNGFSAFMRLRIPVARTRCPSYALSVAGSDANQGPAGIGRRQKRRWRELKEPTVRCRDPMGPHSQRDVGAETSQPTARGQPGNYAPSGMGLAKPAAVRRTRASGGETDPDRPPYPGDGCGGLILFRGSVA